MIFEEARGAKARLKYILRKRKGRERGVVSGMYIIYIYIYIYIYI